MSKFVTGDIVCRTATGIKLLPEGSLCKVTMLTGPSSIKLCNGMSYHEAGFRHATVKEQQWYKDTINGSVTDEVLDEMAQATGRALDAMSQQVGGDHYKELVIQPLQLTLLNMGYEAFRGACYTKINKYMIRDKDAEVGQLKKAAHVLQMWIEEAEKQNAS